MIPAGYRYDGQQIIAIPAEFRESSRGRSLEVFAKDFAQFDKDGDGFLELSEVEQLLQFQLEKSSVPDDQLQKYFAELDTDLDGKVSLAEYIRSIDSPADPNAASGSPGEADLGLEDENAQLKAKVAQLEAENAQLKK